MCQALPRRGRQYESASAIRRINTCGAPWFIRHARHVTDVFIAVERRIREHQGELLHTQSGLPMTYVVDGDRAVIGPPSR